MITLYQLTTPTADCTFLPQRQSSFEYVFVAKASAREYQDHMLAGWRRFGRSFFHPVCSACQACQSLRIPVDTFRPDRSQLRARKANIDVKVVVGEPEATDEKLRLYDRFHEFGANEKGWQNKDSKDPLDYMQSFADNPFATEEWCYYAADRLLGVGYVDVLPAGLSAIYFYYDPNERHRSLGTFNVLRIIEAALSRRLPHVYLGYYVAGCRSLEYKARFKPNEVRRPDGKWGSILDHGRTTG